MVLEGKRDSPLVYNLNLKIKKKKKQSNFTNPDPWARIVGSRNVAVIYMFSMIKEQNYS